MKTFDTSTVISCCAGIGYGNSPDLKAFPAKETTHLATEAEACSEYARNIGGEYPERAWLLTSFDTWERNPHYTGPAVPHPETDE